MRHHRSHAGRIVFIRHSLQPGYAGPDNDLFYMDGAMMLFSDARKACEPVLQAL